MLDTKAWQTKFVLTLSDTIIDPDTLLEKIMSKLHPKKLSCRLALNIGVGSRRLLNFLSICFRKRKTGTTAARAVPACEEHPQRLSVLSLGKLVCFAAAFTISSTLAAKPLNVTDAEMKLLPQYCPDTQGFGAGYGSPRAKYWISLMGEGFWHLHHYCWALISIQRSTRHNIGANERLSLLTSAIGDAMYVVNKTKSDFILLPEIYTRIGQAQLKLKEPNKADETFARVRTLKPDYWPAYSHWAEYLLANDKRKEALGVVNAGLQQAPKSKVLL